MGAGLAIVTAAAGVVGAALPASAAPVYEITATWSEGTPATVGKGDVVNAEWRVNINDDAAAPSNEPVDNVTFTAALQHGLFKTLPDLCLTDGVDPVSSISEDGLTLTCNLGTVDQGTAVAVLTPIVADGLTGDQVTAGGTIGDQSADLSPINIQNTFAMDVQFGGNTSLAWWNSTATGVDLDLQWSLRLGKGSEPGPDPVTYRLTVTDPNGGDVSVGTAVPRGEVGCSPFNNDYASGQPWSGLPGYPLDQQAPFVDSCTLTEVSPGQFDLTLSGINYDLIQVPTKDSQGAPLPTDWNYVASGSLWFHVATTQQGSVTLTSSAPTYTSLGGLQSTDLTSNNTTTKAYYAPGAWSASWSRPWTNSGGTGWDDSYRVSAGTNVLQVSSNGYLADVVPETAEYGNCVALDTRYVTYVNDGVTPMVINLRTYLHHEFAPTVEYYVGDDPLLDSDSVQYNPDQFSCGTADGGWTTIQPTDPAAVKAVRMTYPHSTFAVEDADYLELDVQTTIHDDVPIGQDIWMFGNVLINGAWSGSGVGDIITPTPGARYPFTTGRRDILRVIFATPSIQKSADRTVMLPGEAASFTLTYAANGAGAIPETVDGYEIVDTLPAGMTYVVGSATPEPIVSTNGSGQQVLTWTLDGVATNAQHTLTYQAVAGNAVTPGQVLTNTATSALAGTISPAASAQVTVATSGFTTIGKSADTPFIPNVNGDGVGDGSWTVTLRSFDPLPQGFTDTIDILPFVGDGRGTDFAGSYALTGVDAAPGATVYYTTADPATLSDDPADASNGAAGSPAGNTVGWSTTMPSSPTAVRVIGGVLAPGATQAFTVHVATDGVEGGGTLVNRAQARDGHTQLVMRTSAPITVANYYSAALKKEVQDADGVWHDANTVEDYPTFHVGDTIHYRIVVENTGQGTLTGIEISDDQQPELGSFTIDSLAPGESQTHEFQIVADASSGDGVVNTACGAVDLPADSGVAPTINCDPAGFEVEGDPTHTKSLISATPIGGGQWEVVYGLDVSNTSTASTSYSLDDALHFTDQVDVVSATVTASPAGVTLADPVWDGQGNLRVATDVPLAGSDDAGYAPHHYEVTVVADAPLAFDPATGDLPATACGADGDGSDTAFNNTSELTKPGGEVEDDQACAQLPSIDITKTVSAGPTPNGDGTWTVTYDVVATNTGGAAGTYEVTDRMTADSDLTVVSGAVSSAPDGVTPSASWTGRGAEDAPENVIASGVVLPAGGTHTYQVQVVIGLAPGTEGAPIVTDCSAMGEGAPGGLSNAAGIEHNDLTDSAEACVTVGVVTVDKTISDGPTPNGDGTWTIVYDVVAENVGGAAADYDVTDRLHFGEGIEITGAAVITAPDGVETNPDWTGLGSDDDSAENVVAEGVTLAVGDTHTYQVEVTVSLDEATIDPAVLACPTPGSGENGGLANSTALVSNGIVGTDDVCASLPLISIDKSISAGPTGNGDGTWTITYDLVATNTGGAAGDYDLTDQLQYGAGIDVQSASVTSGPDGVATNDAWTGRGTDAGADENVVASGVTLAAGASHTYQVQVVVSLDQETVTPDTLACPEPGSGENGGLANSTGLTHNGQTQTDDACAPLPLIDITKSLSGAVTPVDGQDGVYDAVYELTVTNRGPGAGVYDLDDELAPGDGVEVVAIQDVTTDAPDPVGVNEGFDGLADTRIVTGQPITGAAGAPVVHTYMVTVRYSADLTDVVLPDTDSCTTDEGGTVPGALNNVADVDWNGIEGSDDACVQPGKPTLDKALVSATPVGDGQWEVVYDLTVGNVGTEATTYDLDDELLFAPVITVDSVVVTGPEGVEIAPTFDGADDQRIATDVPIVGLDDEGYAPHVYRVTVVANVPLHFDADDISEDGTGSPACTVPAGSNTLEQGLNNAATLTDETGGTVTDTDCAPVPSIDITKSVVGNPVKGADGGWTVTYDIVATNDGAAEGIYTLTDRLRFGAGLDVTSAQVASTPDGVTASGTWTGQGAEGDAANVIATDVALAAGGVHTYRVVVVADLDTGAADTSTFTCPEPGSGEPGGFSNVAGIGHNGLADTADACDTPDQPGDPGTPGTPGHPDLPRTGAEIAWTAGAAALLLLLGITLVTTRRRRLTTNS